METIYLAVFIIAIQFTSLLLMLPSQDSFATSCGIDLSPPSLKSDSSLLEEATVGQQYVIATTISNHCTEWDQPFVAIIEVRNSDGLAEYYVWQSGILKPKDSAVEVGASWTPSHGDNFVLRTFAVSNLQNPQILSIITTSNVTVAENPSAGDDSEVYGRSSIQLSNLRIEGDFAAVPVGFPTLILVETEGLGSTGLLLLEVRNSAGETVHLVQSETEFVHGSGLGIQWFPSETGKYEIREFAIISLDDPRILTPVLTLELEVGYHFLQNESEKGNAN